MNTKLPEYLAWDAERRTAYRFRPSLRWIAAHDNGCSVSIGFIIGRDITPRQIEAFRRRGLLREVDYAAECETSRPW